MHDEPLHRVRECFGSIGYFCHDRNIGSHSALSTGFGRRGTLLTALRAAAHRTFACDNSPSVLMTCVARLSHIAAKNKSP